MNWRRHSQRPKTKKPITAVVVVRSDGELFILGIYMWRGGKWANEESGNSLSSAEYWWIPETELMASVPGD